MLTLLFLAVKAPDPSSIAETFAKFMEQHPSFTTRYTVNGGDQCVLTVHRPKQFRFEIHRPDYDYVMIRSGNDGIEFSRMEKIFAQLLTGPRLAELESQISDLAPSDLANVLLVGDIRPMIRGAALSVMAAPAGALALHAELSRGSGSVSLSIDKSGRPLTCEIHLRSLDGVVNQVFAFSSFGGEMPGTSYSLQAPMGYSNYFLPTQQMPLDPGTPVPNGSWATATGERIDLAELCRHGMHVLVVLDQSQVPSQRAGKHLAELQAAIGGKAKMLILSNAPFTLAGADTLIDRTKSFEAVCAAGAPLFYLAHDGKLERNWLGDDEATRAATYKDIAAALGS